MHPNPQGPPPPTCPLDPSSLTAPLGHATQSGITTYYTPQAPKGLPPNADILIPLDPSPPPHPVPLYCYRLMRSQFASIPRGLQSPPWPTELENHLLYLPQILLDLSSQPTHHPVPLDCYRLTRSQLAALQGFNPLHP